MSRRKRSSRNDAPPKCSPPTAPRVAPPARRGRVWLFRFIALTLIPLFCFLSLEAVLRVARYGHDTAFLVRDRRKEYVTNRRYGWRFFPRAIARAPMPQRLLETKPPGTYRIFVLGESAAQGFPDPAFNFGRMLEVMLHQAYPATQFEVINTAMTAINSHVVRLIAQDCARFDPDLFVVYLGNNEVVGPYGPGTVFAGFSPSLGVIRFSGWAKSTRLGQVIENLVGNVGRGNENHAQRVWRGMEMFQDKIVTGD
ncbi:MAG TPA: hypothetical protein VIY86_13150, partial [Pirellulaceae bacterium]